MYTYCLLRSSHLDRTLHVVDRMFIEDFKKFSCQSSELDFLYMLEIRKLRFYNITWHIQDHTDINWSGPGLSDLCNLYIPHHITLPLFCLAILTQEWIRYVQPYCMLSHLHYVFKLPREMTVVGCFVFLNPPSTSHIYECVNGHFKNVSINIKSSF